MNSIKSRFLVGMTVVALPLFVLGVGSLYYIADTLHSLDEVMEEAFDEVIPVMRIENLIARSAMPANDYIVHGNKNERREFDIVEQMALKAFSELLMDKFDLDKEGVLLKGVYADWQKGREMSRRVLSLDNPNAVPGITGEMERMDAVYDSALGKIETLIETMVNEAATETMAANTALHKMFVLVVCSFSIGLVLLLVIGLVVSRSILRPLSDLEEGVRQFGEGRFDAHVQVRKEDEIGRLARTFNQMADHIREFAARDGLTGILDRREFDRRIHEEVQRARRYKHPLGLLMIDLDHFKSVNEEYGHLVGDSILIGVTKRIVKTLRPVDKTARYGGEEIVVILPETDRDGTVAAAERICCAVADEPFTADDDRDLRVTVSVGAAVYPDNALDEIVFIEEAEVALQKAKEMGRNCVECSETIPESGMKN